MASDAQVGAWLVSWVDRLDNLGLSLFVEPFLDLAQVFGPLGANALRALEPFVAGVIEGSDLDRLASLLDEPRLILELQGQLRESVE